MLSICLGLYCFFYFCLLVVVFFLQKINVICFFRKLWTGWITTIFASEMFQSDRYLFQTLHDCMKRFHWKYGGSIVNIYQFLPRYCPCISTTNQTINLLHVYYKNSIIWILYDLFSRLWLHCYDTVFNNCYSSYFFISTKNIFLKKKTLTIVYFTNVHNKNIARALITYKTAL